MHFLASESPRFCTINNGADEGKVNACPGSYFFEHYDEKQKESFTEVD